MKFVLAAALSLALLAPASAQPSSKDELEMLKAVQSKLRAELERIEARAKQLSAQGDKKPEGRQEESRGKKEESKKEELKKEKSKKEELKKEEPKRGEGRGPGGFGPGGPGGPGGFGPGGFGPGPKEEPKKEEAKRPEGRGPGGFGPPGFGGGFGPGRGFGPGSPATPGARPDLKGLVEFLDKIAKDGRSVYSEQAKSFAAKLHAFHPGEHKPEARTDRRPETRPEPRAERRPEPSPPSRTNPWGPSRSATPTSGGSQSVDARLEHLEKMVEEIRNELRRGGGSQRGR